MTNVYSGGVQVDDAQSVIERHAQSMASGACQECGGAFPCDAHQAASKVFWRALRLPQRVPGLSRPELYGARRIGRPGMFAQGR